MKLFIVSYPEHANLTKFVTPHALANIKGVTELIYLWDDLYPSEEKCPLKNSPIIKFSEFKHTDKVDNGWFRQQFVKLQLHHITDDDKFYVMDGDTLIRNSIDLRPNKLIKTGEHHVPYFDFIEYSLELKKQNDFSFISPLLLMERRVLESLEDYSIKLKGCNVIESFLRFRDTIPKDSMFTSHNNTYFSEAEIYGTFATQILNIQYEYVRSPIFETNDLDEYLHLLDHTNYNLVWSGPGNKIDLLRD